MNNEEYSAESEIERRIKIIESKEYKFAKRFNKKDYIFTIIVAVFCLIIIIIGAYL